MPPPIVDITLLDGLWDELNRELGTLFDVAEEEEVGPDVLPRMAEIVLGFAERHYSGRAGRRRMRVGKQIAPKRKVLIAEMPYADLAAILSEFSRFLVDAAQKARWSLSLSEVDRSGSSTGFRR
jgi:hypothetical protein